MSYLFLPQITRLWLKYGEIDMVIKIGQHKRLHSSLHHIAAKQMANDISWLNGTLKQSLKKKGKQIVKHFRDSHDGLSVWKQFLDTYRYGGDVDVYIARQQDILRVRYTPDYPGKELGFLEDYETAFINIDAVSETPLHNDQLKRQTFINNFSLIGHTNKMADNVFEQTDTWEQLVSSLRTKLARRSAQSTTEGKRFAHLSVSGNDEDEHIVKFYINTIQSSQDWKVGYALWKSLTDKQ